MYDDDNETTTDITVEDNESSSNDNFLIPIAGALFGLGLFAYSDYKEAKEKRELEELRVREKERIAEAQERARREVEQEAKKARAAERRAARNAFLRKHWKIIGIVAVIFIAFMGAKYKVGEWKKKIPVTISSASAMDMDYKEVVELLRQQGFTNIKTKEDKTLTPSHAERENTVEQIQVAGDAKFEEDAKYPYDTSIVITYYAMQEVPIGISAKKIRGKQVSEIEGALRKEGFSNIQTSEIKDLVTGFLTKDGEIESVSISGLSEFDEEEVFRLDAKIVLEYHTFKDE